MDGERIIAGNTHKSQTQRLTTGKIEILIVVLHLLVNRTHEVGSVSYCEKIEAHLRTGMFGSGKTLASRSFCTPLSSSFTPSVNNIIHMHRV
jgi:hypothetical protein